MSDLPANGLSGAVGAAFVVGFQWAKSMIGKNGNGNGSSSQHLVGKFITREEYEARHKDIMDGLRRIENKVDNIHL